MSRHKKYNKMSLLFTFKELWKHLFMNFITDLSLLLYREIVYNAILIVMNRFIKMIRYFSVKQTIFVFELADLFADKILKLHKKSQFIVTDRDSLFISQYWSDFCTHMQIRCLLFIIYHLQINDQIEYQN